MVVRKEGVLGLENHEASNEFLQKAIGLCVDGHPPELVEEALAQESQQMAERYEVAERVFRGIGESAPAIGMLGTLVGLVQMLNSLDDPSSIGPAMAVALLTTLYGTLMATIVAIPIADKLKFRAMEEERIQKMVVDGLLSIQAGQNPRIIESMLKSYLPTSKRGAE
jgi:chemotaxis protein MotA